MLNRRIFNFQLDILKIGLPPVQVGSVKQLDGTTFYISLRNGDRKFDLSDCVVRLYFKRADDYSGFQKTQIQILEEGMVVIDCIDEIFEIVGDVVFEVEIADMDGYIETTPEFKVKVVDKIGDDADREIIRVEEVSLIEELKNYIEDSVAHIDEFKTLLNQMADGEYQGLLEQIVDLKDRLVEMQPAIAVEIEKLEIAMQQVADSNVVFENAEESRVLAEDGREQAESERTTSEEDRKAAEIERALAETDRQEKEIERQEAEEKRFENDALLEEAENNRVVAEEERAMSETQRKMSEEERVQAEVMRQSMFADMREDIDVLEDRVDNFSANGNFSTSIVTKGNLYATLDGVRPSHAGDGTRPGPPTGAAGNVLMPYARAVGGFTKDGTGVRTIGMIIKPMDADKNIDITEEQNIDSVFLGTNVSQLFLYSKEKYPTIVSEGELSPIATQDWVMRLVEGLGLLSGAGDSTPAVTSTKPSELFDMALSAQWSTVDGEWRTSDEGQAIMLLNGQPGLYKPLICNPEINEVTYVKGGQVEDSKNDLFIGMWKTENYIYGCRISGRTLNISYFGANGVRGGANSFTLREELLPGDTVTMHYNFSNDIWEIYKFDPNNEPILVYQMSKFMMSGFPEFLNGRNVKPTFSVLVNTQGGMHFVECPNPDSIRDHNAHAMDGYIF